MNQPLQAMIVTVGLGEKQGGEVLDGLQADLKEFQPDYTVLLASNKSLPTARRLVELAGLADDQCEILELTSAHDLDEVFLQTNQLIERLIQRGFPADRIAINYTGGTKVMGTGAVLSGVYNRVMQLRYISGMAKSSEADQTAKHRTLTARPGAVYAYQDLLRARAMMLDLRFRPAHTTLESIEPDLLTRTDRSLHRELTALAQAYGEWDNFYSERFLATYETISFEHDSLTPFRLSDEQFAAVRQLAHEMGRGRPAPYIITELFNSATRRLMVGRTEDALTRLYRALEMLAQWVLERDFEIDINDVDTRRIPPRDRVGFDALRSMEDGLVKIGLRRSYDLLVILESPVGISFREDPVMVEFMEHRGESILSHGLRPADPESCRQFIDRARELFKVEIPDFDDQARLLKFPWLIDRSE